LIRAYREAISEKVDDGMLLEFLPQTPMIFISLSAPTFPADVQVGIAHKHVK
jgi:hypothetical protein